MAQYNLIHTGSIQSNTISGTGNKTLTNDELMTLYDGNTTSSGISLISTDVLYLDIDMGYRVRIDDIKLYINVLGDRASALTNVDFYYKNSESDSYTICSKDYDSTTFYIVGTPSLFAPRYLRIVVDSQESDIYELAVLNDDTQVSFGQEGDETLIILNQTLTGYDELGIFNNSPVGSKTVNAYVIVDYQGKDSDYYIKLSSTVDGTYCGLNDGIELSNNDMSKTYHWAAGVMDNTSSDTIDASLINKISEVGYYTSPIFDIGDKLNNTFVLTDITTCSGTSITWDDSFPGGTMYLRSSDTTPIPFNKLLWVYTTTTTDDSKLYVGDMTTGYVDDGYYTLFNSGSTEVVEVKFDRWRGKVYVMSKDTANQHSILRYDYKDRLPEDYSTYSALNTMDSWDIDNDGCVWGYVKVNGYKLVLFDYALANRTVIKESDTSDFLGALSACKHYHSCWYTDTAKNKLVHINYLGDTIASVSIDYPGSVAALPDGGCFAISHGLSAIIRYDYYGNEVSTIAYSSTLTINHMSFGVHGGNKQPFDVTRLWLVVDSSRVLQIDYDGNFMSDTDISGISNIEAFPGGCLVFREALNTTVQLNTDGESIYTWDFSTYDVKGGMPYPVTIYYDEYLTMTNLGSILPIPTDLVWGNDANWKEVPLNGEKLPFYRYHQLKFKLTPNSLPAVNIINPGAETGDLTGWTQETPGYPFYVATDEVYSGTYSFKSSYYNSAISQMVDITTISGIDLNIVDSGDYIGYASAMVKSPSNPSYFAGIEDTALFLNFLDYFYESLGEYRTPSIINSYWKQHQLGKRIPSGTRYIEIKLYVVSGISSGYKVWFDDVTLDIFRTPSLNKVIVPTPVVINDLQPQEFKNIYIKTEIPTDASYGEYETSLKCWWGNEE